MKTRTIANVARCVIAPVLTCAVAFTAPVTLAQTGAPGAADSPLPSCPDNGTVPIGETTVQTPSVGARSQAEVGQSVVSAAAVKIHPYKLLKEVVFAGGPEVEGYTASLQPGALKFQSIGVGGVVYSTPGTAAYKGRPLSMVGIVIIPDGTTAVWAGEAGRAFGTTRWFRAKVPDGVVQLSRCIGEKGQFQRDLIYSGRSGSTVSLTYRETYNDVARPAFSQELKYDISTDSEIGFRGARLKVIEATNTAITYEILAPLR